MIFKYILSLAILVVGFANCLEFSSSINPMKQRCFFEVLNQNQKYKVDLYPETGGQYSLQISYLNKQNNKWQIQYSKKQLFFSQPVHVHRLADVSSTYKICLKNYEKTKNFTYQINISSGIELLQLHLLPNSSDAQNLAREIEWIRQQTQYLRQVSSKVNGLKASSQILSSIASYKLTIFVVIFSVAVILLNGLFYVKIKKALHQRKII